MQRLPPSARHAGARLDHRAEEAQPTVAPYVRTERQLEYETCVSCHRQTRSQLTKPSHHPIIEGKITCSNCHNPHGALSKAMLNYETIPQLCTTCHQEKRGPFVYTRRSRRTASPAITRTGRTTTACSPKRRRMSARTATTLRGTPARSTTQAAAGTTPATPNTRLIARGCINCHYFVHGSNAPAMRGKFFLR